MKKRLRELGFLAALLIGTTANLNAGILYSSVQKDKNSMSETKVKQKVNLDAVLSQIKQKYPVKKLEYFSRGFLQFEQGDFIRDSKIANNILGLGNSIDAANLYADFCIMLDPNFYHVGDGKKKWFPVNKEPDGKTYTIKFNIDDFSKLKNPRLGLEIFTSDSENPIYLNGKLLGYAPYMGKGKWGDIMKKHKENCPFLYGEIPISNSLKEGENILRIESKKSRGLFGAKYDDFLMRRIQIVYSKE